MYEINLYLFVRIGLMQQRHTQKGQCDRAHLTRWFYSIPPKGSLSAPQQKRIVRHWPKALLKYPFFTSMLL